MHYRLLGRVVTGLLLSITAAMMFGCSSSSKEGGTAALYNASQAGKLQSAIQKVDIPADGKPLVTFSLFDQNGQPLDPATLTGTAGRFQAFIGRLDDTDNYQNYFLTAAGKPTGDPAATASQFTSLGNGQYTYKFAQSITTNPPPAGVPAYDQTKTHTVAMVITQSVIGSTGKATTVVSNPYITFRPDGGAVTKTREVVSIEACNECHGMLGHHGGNRREVALCVLCHNHQGEVTSGIAALDLKSLIHKIHMGFKLANNIAADANYSNLVAYPTWTADGNTSKAPVQCVKCHRLGKDLAGRSYGKNVDLWKAAPTRSNCETCHVQMFAVATFNPAAPDHTGFNSTTDCAGCHTSSASKYTSTTATPNAEGAHVLLEDTANASGVLPGLKLEILSVTNSAVAVPGYGFTPTVSFKVTDNAGTPVDPRVVNTVGRYALHLAYIESGNVNYLNSGLVSSKKFGQPTDFTINYGATTATLPTGPVTDKGNGVYEVTFPTGVPTGKTGVGVIGFDGGKYYPSITPKRPTAANVRIYGKPVQYFFDLTTGVRITDPAQQRRKVVDVEKCKACHYSLDMAHGGARSDTQYCVMCHNPNAARVATTATLPPVSVNYVDFKYLMHKVHANVGYGQDLKNCLACHISADTYKVPLVSGVFGNFTSPGYTGDQLNLPLNSMRKTPIVEVCSACHASGMSTNPAYVVNGVETCAQCHTSGTTLGPDSAHKNLVPAADLY